MPEPTRADMLPRLNESPYEKVGKLERGEGDVAELKASLNESPYEKVGKCLTI